MKWIARLLVCVAVCGVVMAGELLPEHVVIVYNGNSPDGERLAEEYAKARAIPHDQIVEVRCADKPDMSREEYNNAVRAVLRSEGLKKGWWSISESVDGAAFMRRKIFALVLMKGMPLRIAAEDKKADWSNTDAAALDSELPMLLVNNYPLKGMIPNPYYNKHTDFPNVNAPIFLVSRIDAPSVDTCLRMISDAVAVEKTGLWGWTIVDRGGPHAEGDEWLQQVSSLAWAAGFPCYRDDWKETIPQGYPLDDVGVYFGWYAGAINGPFRSETFKFRPGALALHLHSYSATTLNNPNKGWSGPLLERGAAVTVGNVAEPYLAGSHHFDIFYDRLLKGYTVAEAAMMSVQVISWQPILLGDPLYRPFKNSMHQAAGNYEPDKAYKTWFNAHQFAKWDGYKNKLFDVAESSQGGFLMEALALQAEHEGDGEFAARCFDKALAFYEGNERSYIRTSLEKADFNSKKDGLTAITESIDNLIARFPDNSCMDALLEKRTRIQKRLDTPDGKQNKK